MADAKSYNETMLNLFNAMDVIVSERVKSLQYDKTITAQIENTDNAVNGEYIVNDGSTSFKAYSENTGYRKGAYVYVTIPEGDFNQQKTIIGKYVKEGAEPYIYSSPLTSFVDITNNLLPDSTGTGLTANGLTQEKIVWAWAAAENEKDIYAGYNILGLKADFLTHLKIANIDKGNYGIRVEINYEENSMIKRASFSIDSSEMYGNPYDFESAYVQEKTFDISKFSKIIGIKVLFYQSGNFKYQNNTEVVGSYFSGEDVFEYPNNIFVDNCYLSFGYDVSTFKDETILLYSLNSKEYTSALIGDDAITKDPGESIEGYNSRVETIIQNINTKRIKFRWIHRTEDNNIEIIDTYKEIPKDVIIHVYRYVLNPTSINELTSEVFWEEYTTFSYEDNDKSIEIEKFIPNSSLNFEQLKVVVEAPTKASILNSINDADYGDLQQALKNLQEGKKISIATAAILQRYNDELSEINLETITGYNDAKILELINFAIESIEAPYLAQQNLYISEVLEFTNKIPQGDPSTMQLINGLNIECDIEGNKGIYNIYNNDGKIAQPSESSKKRIITATYSNLLTGQNQYDTGEQITWRFPLLNTMIVAPVLGIEYNIGDSYQDTHDGYCSITRFQNPQSGNAGETQEKIIEQIFRIKDYYTPTAVNNTITCTIIKNGYRLVKDIILSFGTSGTNGTEYTLSLNVLKEAAVLTLDKKDDNIIIEPKLYDYAGNDISEGKVFNFTWVSQPKGFVSSGLKVSSLTSQKQFTIRFPDNLEELEDKWAATKFHIAKVSTRINVDDDRKITLEAFLPIAIRKSLDYYSYDGAIQIAYDSIGVNPNYYKNQHHIYNNSLGVIDDLKWKIEYNFEKSNNDATFYPRITENGFLTVPALYSSGLEQGVNISAFSSKGERIWSQPIYIYQYVYNSSLINSWDGNTDIKEGSILSALVGAGRKTKNNAFDGVLMGEVSPMIGSNSGVFGLYGFNEGAASFGFKIDGTAFIGKSGASQIVFDGKQSKIFSKSYEAGNGLMLDLDSGLFVAKHTSNENGKTEIIINSQTNSLNPSYFSIKRNNLSLIEIQDNLYYLQSADFNEKGNPKSGVKFTLNDGNKGGKLEAYSNFEIQAKSTEGTMSSDKLNDLYDITAFIEESKKSQREKYYDYIVNNIFNLNNLNTYVYRSDIKEESEKLIDKKADVFCVAGDLKYAWISDANLQLNPQQDLVNKLLKDASDFTYHKIPESFDYIKNNNSILYEKLDVLDGNYYGKNISDSVEYDKKFFDNDILVNLEYEGYKYTYFNIDKHTFTIEKIRDTPSFLVQSGVPEDIYNLCLKIPYIRNIASCYIYDVKKYKESSIGTIEDIEPTSINISSNEEKEIWESNFISLKNIDGEKEFKFSNISINQGEYYITYEVIFNNRSYQKTVLKSFLDEIVTNDEEEFNDSLTSNEDTIEINFNKELFVVLYNNFIARYTMVKIENSKYILTIPMILRDKILELWTEGQELDPEDEGYGQYLVKPPSVILEGTEHSDEPKSDIKVTSDIYLTEKNIEDQEDVDEQKEKVFSYSNFINISSENIILQTNPVSMGQSAFGFMSFFEESPSAIRFTFVNNNTLQFFDDSNISSLLLNIEGENIYETYNINLLQYDGSEVKIEPEETIIESRQIAWTDEIISEENNYVFILNNDIYKFKRYDNVQYIIQQPAPAAGIYISANNTKYPIRITDKNDKNTLLSLSWQGGLIAQEATIYKTLLIENSGVLKLNSSLLLVGKTGAWKNGAFIMRKDISENIFNETINDSFYSVLDGIFIGYMNTKTNSDIRINVGNTIFMKPNPKVATVASDKIEKYNLYVDGTVNITGDLTYKGQKAKWASLSVLTGTGSISLKTTKYTVLTKESATKLGYPINKLAYKTGPGGADNHTHAVSLSAASGLTHIICGGVTTATVGTGIEEGQDKGTTLHYLSYT